MSGLNDHRKKKKNGEKEGYVNNNMFLTGSIGTFQDEIQVSSISLGVSLYTHL